MLGRCKKALLSHAIAILPYKEAPEHAEGFRALYFLGSEHICSKVGGYFPNGKRLAGTIYLPRDDGSKIDLENKNTWYILFLQIYELLITYIQCLHNI